jgi:hypothetical protein
MTPNNTDSKYDTADVDEILNNEKLFSNYYNCIMETGDCTTPESQELKKIVPDALKTDCSHCSKIQKEKADDFITFLYRNKKVLFNELTYKYDPSNTYAKKHNLN